ncbi:hypothetical protein HYH02_000963 [Chlamydomonas schloesseri]|uniref:Uncharacterized protein n=1 Tax=Chlamydomonas schloesseri TaxID=2026947 RepID=A0A835WZN9_9CHLO|nr:hypothetical protein HYH02_000963 [Chlamydomonas schloesseri]|eukprot:KAG2455145.1 hypothetical protein HYH02_000963 [Chlamydomonas schloesseri]
MAAVAVEAVAAAALRARLRSHGRVSVRLAANGWDMLAGRVEGAAVEGRLWESPLGLTARILDVEVGRVELDLGAALQQQRIVLRNTPLGAARVVFSGPDFGAFLQHPLVRAAAARAVQGLPFSFDREVLVLPPSAGTGTGAAGGTGNSSGGATGAVLFSGVLRATQQRYQLTMRPAQGGRAVTVSAVPVGAAAAAAGAGALAGAAAGAAALAGSFGGSGRSGGAATAAAPLAPPAAGLSTASAGSVSNSNSFSTVSSLASSSADGGSDPVVSAELTRFFSRLTVDLQGAELAFDGLAVGQAAALAARDNASAAGRSGAGGGGGGGGGPKLVARDAAEGWIDLRLKATVRDFPPLNLQF